MRTDPETDPIEITCWVGIGIGFCLLAYWTVKWLVIAASAQSSLSIASKPEDTSLSITINKSLGMGFANSVLVTIKPDGTIEYGKDYTPEAAAKALWDAVGIERKARNCP